MLSEFYIRQKHELLARNFVGKTRGSNPLFSLNFYRELIRDDQCHYCFGPLSERGISLDWLVPGVSNGGDAVPCCLRCLEMKGLFSFKYHEMRILASGLRQIQEERTKFKQVDIEPVKL